MTVACRCCGAGDSRIILSLGNSPLANAFLSEDQLRERETFYPLDLRLCDECFLVQLEAVETPENIFTDYAYFSSYSTTWLAHAQTYAEQMIDRFGLGSSSRVVEIASNDGYLLQFFKERGIPVLGIDPARNVAEAACRKGIPTRVAFWTEALAETLADEGHRADLLVGNNVLAHVPALNDFVAGLRILLKPRGIITMEFPHLYRLVAENQFDTIYHEHLSYFSFSVVCPLFARHGLTVFDVEELATHGGSLRIYARHEADSSKPVSRRVDALLAREKEEGMGRPEYYGAFGKRVAALKRDILTFLIDAKQRGKRVVAYGAPAKATTLLNYCGIRTDFIDYTVDRSVHKQGLFMPGVHIPICAPDKVATDKPDYLFVLPWNLKDEIISQMAFIREWGAEFVVPIPKVTVIA